MRKAKGNIVGFLSQIGWGGSSEGDAPSKVITMEKIYILVDTDGGNFWVVLGILHSKIQHRLNVINQVRIYLQDQERLCGKIKIIPI